MSNASPSPQVVVDIRKLVYENSGLTVPELSSLTGIAANVIHMALLTDPECRAMAHDGYVAVFDGRKKPQWYREAPDRSLIPVKNLSAYERNEKPQMKTEEPATKRPSVDESVQKLVALIKKFPQETAADYAFRGGFSSAQRVNDLIVSFPPLRRMASAGMIAVPTRGHMPAWFKRLHLKTQQKIPRKDSINFGQQMIDAIVIDPDMDAGLASYCKDVITLIGNTRLPGKKWTALIEQVGYGTVGLAQSLDTQNKRAAALEAENREYVALIEKHKKGDGTLLIEAA
jgi:hypothetical protein